MGKLSLEIKATLEGIEEMYTNHPDYSFSLKLKCTSCGESSDKWHDVIESQTFPGKTGRSENNYIAKCKLCGRENSLDILPGTNGKYPTNTSYFSLLWKCITGKYTNDDQGSFRTLVTFDCRGIEPTEFTPGEGWIVKAEESGKIFENVNLTEKEWVEYDEKSQQSIGIYEFESRFVTVK